MPKISVIMSVYNVEGKSTRGLDSMLLQEFDDYEVIVVNDGSTDNTQTILEQYAQRDSRIHIVQAPCNLGLAGALNLAICHARSDLLMRMDIDDWSVPERMRKQYDYMVKYPEIGVISSTYEIFFEDIQARQLIVLPLNHVSISKKLSLASGAICHAGAMIRKICFLRYGYYNPMFRRVQDYELWLRWRRYVRFANLDDCLLQVYWVRYPKNKENFYQKLYQYDLLARYLNFPYSTTKLRDVYGFFRMQFAYFFYHKILDFRVKNLLPK